MIIFLVVVGSFLALLLFVFGLVLSHKVAGPLVKFINFLEDHSGKKTPGFRKNDFFQELVPAFEKYDKEKSEKLK